MHEHSRSLASKGKAKESMHWHLGWWDLCHSLEGTRRPLQWSKSSVLFTTHESQALILASHFPTSRQVILPSPHLDLSLYEPATVLSISSTDDWLFAYFPGKGCGGLGCLWHKVAQLDHWAVKEYWHYQIGGGVVTAAWTTGHREWVVSDSGTSSRLPPLGPLTPAANPLLLLVTESHLLHVYNITLSPHGKPMQPTRASLLQPIDLHPPNDPDSIGKVGGDRTCVKAAIGLCYQEPSILVAMRSQLLPSPTSSSSFQNTMDLGIPMDLGSDNPSAAEWELWGEEQVISLCEVRIEYRPNVPPVLTRPLPPIYHPSARLVDLVFYCPPQYDAASPNPASSKPDSKSSVPAPHMLHLVATFLDAEDYTSLPKSEILSYTFLTKSVGCWTLRAETKRPNQAKIPCFLLPSVHRGGLIAGFLDAGGLLPRRKSKTHETVTGAIEVLKIPDLSTHADWESVPLHSHVEAGTIDGERRTATHSSNRNGHDTYILPMPVSVVLSPSEALICSLSSPLLGSHSSIQALPRRVSGGSSLATLAHLNGDLSKQLVLAIHARYSSSDVIHSLAMPSLPVDIIANTLYQALTTMEANSSGKLDMWTSELVGVATEVYSARTQRLGRGAEQDLCAARWQTAHEIASLSVCCDAFDHCREGDVYDLDAVWQLLSMTGYITNFVEKLFRECIFVGERPDPGPSTPKEEKDTSLVATLDSPIFLHIAHPHALSKIQIAVEHVKRFHDQLVKVATKGENSHIAKEMLLDTTEGSGIDLQLIGLLLTEIMQDCKKLDAESLRRSLASCSPVPSLKLHIRKVIDQVLTSKAIDRARLFIKPSDLSDGIARMTLSEPTVGSHPTARNVDVMKKGMLPRNKVVSICVRCGGRSDLGAEVKTDGPLSRWQAWEKRWSLRCLCSGLWASAV